MIVLIFMATLQGHWGVAIKTFDTKAECFVQLDLLEKQYKKKYPEGMLWCAEPIGYSGK